MVAMVQLIYLSNCTVSSYDQFQLLRLKWSLFLLFASRKSLFEPRGSGGAQLSIDMERGILVLREERHGPGFICGGQVSTNSIYDIYPDILTS